VGREGSRALIPTSRPDTLESPRAHWITFASKFFCFIQFLPLAMLAAGVFGAFHDQISYTVSSEYYTKFKFPMFGLVDAGIPDRLRAAEVGFLASWWMGIPIGLLAGPAGFIQRTPPQMFRALMWCLAVMTGFTMAFALGGLVTGFFETSHLDLADFRDWYIPDGLEHPRRFLCAGSMHNAAYMGGAISILVAWVFNILFRRHLDRANLAAIQE
jgi:hypothetical protein